MDINTASELIEIYLDQDIPVLCYGPPGVGKSDSVRRITDKRKWSLIDFRAVLRDPVDLRGLPAADINNKKAIWLVPDELPDEKRDGKHGILFMDELNTASIAVMNSCLGLVLDRKIGEYHLPKGWRIVAAGNRQSDRAAVNRVSSALASRFARIDIEPDMDAFIEYCNNEDNEVNEMIPAFIHYRPALLHSMEGTDMANPRSWARVSKVIEVPDRLRMKAVAGIVGEGPAGEFEAFVRTFRDLPDFDEIIKKPKETPVPTDPGGKYAVSGMLSRRAKRGNFNAIVTYAKRLGREFEIVTVLDATKRDASLCETTAFADFTLRNKDVTLPMKH